MIKNNLDNNVTITYEYIAESVTMSYHFLKRAIMQPSTLTIHKDTIETKNILEYIPLREIKMPPFCSIKTSHLLYSTIIIEIDGKVVSRHMIPAQDKNFLESLGI